MTEHVHLLRSPRSGSPGSRRRAAEIVEGLREREIRATDLTGGDPSESRRRLAAALAEGAVERLLVAGGDGLVNLAVQELAMSSCVLGVLPTGTGNDFAAALGLEHDLDQALGAPTNVDLVRVTWPDGAAWAASIAIVGFPARINARAERLALPLGSAIYAVAAMLELPTFHRDVVDLRIDGDDLATDTAMLAFGNTRFFGGGMLACPDARHDDGLLHLTSIEGVGRIGMLRHLAGRRGGTADRPEVLRRSGTAVEVETAGLGLWADGEPICTTPARLEVVPGAVRVAGVPN